MPNNQTKKIQQEKLAMLEKAFEHVETSSFADLLAHVAKAMITEAYHPFITDDKYRPPRIELQNYIHTCHQTIDLMVKTHQANIWRKPNPNV